MEIKIKKLDETAKLPTRGSEQAAGYDLYALERTEVECGKTAKIHTGVAVAIPEGYFGAIYARSGLAAKQGLRPANCVGVIDSDYRGEVIVALHNDNPPALIQDVPVSAHAVQHAAVPNPNPSYTVEMGERIAQLVIQKYEEVNFVEVDELDESVRGEGGFGSTGTN